ncbi:MAG: hypothetical protein ACPL4E_03845 [Thermoproteota archaeon]
MEKNEDAELERIKQAKMREIMKRAYNRHNQEALENQETSLKEPVKMTDANFKETI